MKYWHIQLHPGEYSSWYPDDIKNTLSYHLIGCSGKPITSFMKIKINDIVMIRHGGTVIAIVQVTGNPRDTLPSEKNENIWFDKCADIRVLRYYSNTFISGDGWFIPNTLMRVESVIK